MEQQLIFTQHVTEEIDRLATRINPARTFVLVDTNTSHFVLPLLQSESEAVKGATLITIPSGDVNKGLESAAIVWKALTAARASRHDLLINVGGGVVTDLGGFAAATYKRGIHFINVPTTLLGAVDAATGGKTGVNFDGFKNQIGVFSEADAVIISTVFFNTLTRTEMLSGYAELVKHALLTSNKEFTKVITHELDDSQDADNSTLLRLLEHSVNVKKKIVDADPHEAGLRKALNFGHTAGHAFEAMALKQLNPVPHGYAVAWGMVVETVLSHMLRDFPSDTVHALAAFVRRNYGTFHFTCDDYPALLSFMAQDKKNHDAAHINFTLLEKVGHPCIDCTADDKQITTALDIFRDMMGI